MTIVAGIDSSAGSSTVLMHASELARDLDEPLHAVHVLQRGELVSVLEKDVEGQALTENYEIRRIGEEIVERTARQSPIVHNNDAIETIIRVGDPAEELATYADEVNAQYLVVGGRRRSPTGKALFGSVTQQVMFDAVMPVVNVPLDER
jgi:nucleotide-binding universal stress UspA family protein